MNALQSYDSGSEEDSAGPSKPSASINAAGASAAPVKRAISPDEDDNVTVEASDAFGLQNLSGGDASASEDAQRNKASKRSREEADRPTGSGAASRSQAGSFNALTVTAAPGVIDADPSAAQLLTRPSDTSMHVNLRYTDMTAPIIGPENPFAARPLGSQANTLTGHIEEAAMSDFDFRAQQRTFESLGYARNPSNLAQNGGNGFVGDKARALALKGASAFELRGGDGESRKAARALKKQRKGQDGSLEDVGEGGYAGPWGGWHGEKVNVAEGVGPTPEEIKRAEERSTNRQLEKLEMEARRRREDAAGTEKSVFHGKSMYDYQGRTYMHVPTDVDTNLKGQPGTEQSFIPKACIHTWTGHTKGVSAIRLLPGSGHLMLSGSMDTQVKLWDVYHDGKCLRTYMGHNKAVRDVTFSPDGRRFLSASYDRQMKLWDTETGQCIRAFSNGKVPNVVRFHPDKPNIFLAGMSDKKITQFNTDDGEVTQEYDQHLGPVNSITFVDENRRFVTTSDDKTMRAWDFDIPVVVKYIADPTMHSMPVVATHPNKKWLACQSLDNHINVFASDSFRQNRKKIFSGHHIAGYACQLGFSPDGRFISSGDSEGNVVFWDWKSGKLLKRLRAHKDVVISHEWLPHETSKLVTGSWDGTIKLWD
ncbi:mRNA splicing factor [Ceraceosorus bombacis]|uniref:Pre-mRNA-processing factor 17 n=1 Tax=Ceraceosorus bombacis TaxID=401625 RepID=A0A0P1BSI7_9BASI|nr:mRNA splicing factor [Ceraceosorus bombacis]